MKKEKEGEQSVTTHNAEQPGTCDPYTHLILNRGSVRGIYPPSNHNAQRTTQSVITHNTQRRASQRTTHNAERHNRQRRALQRTMQSVTEKTEKRLNKLLKSPYSVSFGFISPKSLPVPNSVLYTFIGTLFMNNFDDFTDIDDD